MRWIFISLVILNGGYFAWGMWQSQQEANVADTTFKPSRSASGASSESYVPSIVLLDEAKSVDLAYEEPKGEEIISKAPEITKPPTVSKLAFPDIKSSVVKKETLCGSVGPFKKIKSAESLQVELAQEGLAGQIQEILVDSYMENWVILPALPSRREALSKLRELQSKGIDSYVLTRGEWNNSISLGLFKRRNSAVGVRNKMNDAGYGAELREVKKEVYEYWVKVSPKNDQQSIKSEIEKLIAAKTAIKFQESLCE